MAKQRWRCTKCGYGMWLYLTPSEPPRHQCKPNVKRSYAMEKVLEQIK